MKGTAGRVSGTAGHTRNLIVYSADIHGFNALLSGYTSIFGAAVFWVAFPLSALVLFNRRSGGNKPVVPRGMQELW